MVVTVVTVVKIHKKYKASKLDSGTKPYKNPTITKARWGILQGTGGVMYRYRAVMRGVAALEDSNLPSSTWNAK